MEKVPCLALVFCFALSGCGAPADNEASKLRGKNAGAGSSGWDATNACRILDRKVVGEILGEAVTETSLALVHQATAAEAATSECTYLLASGSRLTFMTRNSPIADNTNEAMDTARKAASAAVKAFSSKPVETVEQLGTTAFYVAAINQLSVFLDDSRFVIVTMPDSPNAKEKAVALVRRVS